MRNARKYNPRLTIGEFGVDLEGDICLRRFLVETFNERSLWSVIESYRGR